MRKREKFGFALATSLVLHLLLLWPAVSLDGRGEAAQPLSVVLPPQQGPASVKTGAVRRSPDAAMHASRDIPSVLPGEKTMLAKNDPSASPLNNTPTSTTEIGVRSGSSAPGPAVDSQAASPQAASVNPALQTLDADGVRQYRMALAVEARRFKRYPPRALAEEVGGTVEVRVAVAAGGQTQEVALARSSGYGALDDAALEMMRKAAPRTTVPELLRRRPFVINLPVVFDVAGE